MVLSHPILRVNMSCHPVVGRPKPWLRCRAPKLPRSWCSVVTPFCGGRISSENGVARIVRSLFLFIYSGTCWLVRRRTRRGTWTREWHLAGIQARYRTSRTLVCSVNRRNYDDGLAMWQHLFSKQRVPSVFLVPRGLCTSRFRKRPLSHGIA